MFQTECFMLMLMLNPLNFNQIFGSEVEFMSLIKSLYFLFAATLEYTKCPFLKIVRRFIPSARQLMIYCNFIRKSLDDLVINNCVRFRCKSLHRIYTGKKQHESDNSLSNNLKEHVDL